MIGNLNCFGSLTDVNIHSPNGNMYVSDLDLLNGDERYMWLFEDDTSIGSYLKANCLDLVCPLTMPCEYYPLVYDDDLWDGYDWCA